MLMRSAEVSFERLTLADFIFEVKKAKESDALVNTIAHGDTLDLIHRFVGEFIKPTRADVTLKDTDIVLLITIKRRRQFKDIFEALKAGNVFFWKVRVVRG